MKNNLSSSKNINCSFFLKLPELICSFSVILCGPEHTHTQAWLQRTSRHIVIQNNTLFYASSRPLFSCPSSSAWCTILSTKSSRPQVLLVAEKSLRDSPIYEAVLLDPPKPVSVITPPRTRWADDHVECLPPCLPTEGKPTKIKGKIKVWNCKQQ